MRKDLRFKMACDEMKAKEMSWLQDSLIVAFDTVHEQIHENLRGLNMKKLAEVMEMSRPTLYKKLHDVRLCSFYELQRFIIVLEMVYDYGRFPNKFEIQSRTKKL